MPFKVILNVDPETGESDNFLWNEKEEPPPLVRGKIKKSEAEQSIEREEDTNNKCNKLN